MNIDLQRKACEMTIYSTISDIYFAKSGRRADIRDTGGNFRMYRQGEFNSATAFREYSNTSSVVRNGKAS